MRSSVPFAFVLSSCLATSAVVALPSCSREAPKPDGPTTSTAGVASTPSTPAPIAVGKPAPDFTATAHDGSEIKISALKGKPVVLYFYPKDETPGCTKEACAFRDAWKDLEKRGVVLVGISADDNDSHRAFAKAHQLPFHLVSDGNGSIAKLFDVPNRAGFLSRQTIVIGPDGNVKKIYREVDVTKHASEILADIQS